MFEEGVTLHLSELDNTCRLCLKEMHSKCFSLFTYQIEEQYLYEFLQTITQLVFKEDDGLPQLICNNCMQQINFINTFIQDLRNVDHVLRSIICENSISEDISIEKKELVDLENTTDLLLGPVLSEVDAETHLTCNELNELRPEEISKSDIKIFEPTSPAFLLDDHTYSESSKNLNIDTINSSSDGRCRCSTCAKEFSSYTELDLHVKEHFGRRSRVCDICFEVFRSTSNLNRHKRCTHLGVRPYVCETCGKGYTRKINLDEHKLTHLGIVPYLCQYCGKTSRKLSSHRGHLLRHKMDNNITLIEDLVGKLDDENNKDDSNETKTEEEMVFSCGETRNQNATANNTDCFCNECGKKFSSVQALRKHCCDQDQKKSFDCGLCSKKFPLYSKLKEHIAVHVKNRERSEFNCMQCQFKCKSTKELRSHQSFHKEQSCLCNVCGKRFVSEVTLKAHLRTHSGERPYKCRYCDRAFSFRTSLTCHLNTHTGLKQFTCGICKRAFAQRSHLSDHLRTHSGEKPYVCTFCSKAFALKKNLVVHTRIHTGVTPFVCTICNTGCNDSSILKKHVKRFHNTELLKTSKGQSEGKQSPILGKNNDTITTNDVNEKDKNDYDLNKTGKFSDQVLVDADSNCTENEIPVDLQNSYLTNEEKQLNNIQTKSVDNETSQEKHLNNTEISVLNVESNNSEDYRIIGYINIKDFFNASRLESEDKDNTLKILVNPDKIKSLLYSCSTCSKTFSSRTKLEMHSKMHNVNKSHVCEFCFKGFSIRANLVMHIRKHTGERPFVCNVCGKGYTRKVNLDEHKVIHTGDISYLCQYCGKSSRKYSIHKSHLMWHKKSEGQILTENVVRHLWNDQNKINSIISMQRENREMKSTENELDLSKLASEQDCPNVPDFLCTECGKNFLSKQALQNHYWSHDKDKHFECGFCSKKFSMYQSLKRHVGRHVKNDGKGEFNCIECNRRFHSNIALKKHLSVHKERSLLCNHCGKRFIDRTGLRAHLRTHGEKDSFNCEFCDKVLSSSSSYREHLKIHAGVREFVCEICDKRFMKRYILQGHMLTHSGEKPHVCLVCSKSFAHKCNLKVHMRTHSKELPYSCTVCDKKFNHRGAVKKHERRYHNLHEN